ncbi:MAG: hypothetical protein E6J87_24660 [Deltaproteobacteria bacterium]|nr:MAG: hypothetical protein E6J87_24660 [Deltaproteobacteria bacterium]
MEALALVRAPDAPDVETRLALLARSGAPLRRVIAALAGQLVATCAWDRLGYVRPRDYAVERLGLWARQLQDLAHVDRELRGLPRIDAAFVAGELTWTKVRLLCRVAAHDEARWLDLARHLTARALAREVRAVDARSLEAGGAPDTDEDGVDDVPRETVWLRVTPLVRARWGRARLLARQVAGEALSQADVAEVIAAELMSALGVDVDPGPLAIRSSPSESPSRPREPRAKPSTLSPNLPAFLVPLIDNRESADPIELDARLRRALRIEQRLLSEMDGPARSARSCARRFAAASSRGCRRTRSCRSSRSSTPSPGAPRGSLTPRAFRCAGSRRTSSAHS